MPKEQAVRQASSKDDILRCFDCLQELRTHITRDAFADTVAAMQAEGYRLAWLERDDAVIAVAGYRIFTTLFAGRGLYVDDLVTAAAARSQGAGAALLDWLRDEAIRQDCRIFHLDSGVQRDRAHRFYFANGMHVNCFHFAEYLDPD